MRKCPSCNIEVDGARDNCPLCQNTLTGQPSDYNWPSIEKFKHQAMLYKIQLFIVLLLILVSVFLDFMLKLNNGIHYSIFVALWGISSQFLVKSFIKRHTNPAKIVSICTVVFCLLAGITTYYTNLFFVPTFHIIIPSIIGATIITNFIFVLIDKRGNSMAYFLVTILVGIIPYIVLVILHDDDTLGWSICLMVSIASALAIIVFKGKAVLKELERRFNF